MTSSPESEASQSEIAAALAEPALAIAVASGMPLLLATGAPAKVVFATESMLRLFGAANAEALTRRLFFAPDPGARRLAELAQSLPAGAPPRLERLRFYVGRRAEIFTLTCRRVAMGPDVGFFVVAAGLLTARAIENPAPALGSDMPETVDAPPDPEVAGAVPAAAADDTQNSAEAPDLAPAEPKSAEDVARDLAARFGATQSIRFLWQTGPDRGIEKITGPLYEAVGQAAGDLTGQDFATIAERLGLDPDGRLRAALARTDTWSGIQVLWPIEGAAAALPVVLGALPAFDRQRRFEGFRGFGVIHVAPVPHAAVPAVAVEPQPAETKDRRDEHEPSSDAAVEIKPDEATAESFAPSLGENVVPLRPYQAFARALPAPPREADVPLPAEPQEEPSAPSEEENVELSSDEQLAFHEIARRLSNAATDDEALEAAAAAAAEPRLALEAEHDVSDVPVPSSLSELASAASGTESSAADNLAALFDRLPVGLLVSRFGVPVFANRTLLDWLDFPDIESFLVGGGIGHMFGGDPTDRLGEEANERTLALVTREGAPLPVEGRLQAIEWDSTAATLMTLRRVVSPVEAPRFTTLENDLRRSEREVRELRAILDTATDGVAVLDGEGKILSLNRSAEALFGYDQNEVAGEPFAFLLAKESQAAAADYLAGLKSSNVASLLNDGRDVTGRARQGGAIPLFLALGRVGTDGESKFCAVLRDVTQWKKAERELSNARRDAERASALKSDFLAKVSHEIRTPLNAILGFAEVMTEERFGPIGNERYKDYLRDIHASGTHVMSLVNDLLDLSKIEAGKLELDFVHVDANRIVSECVQLMQPQASRERIIVRLSLAPRLPQIVADERSLRQIVLNILSNAIKYNEPGGQVIVSTALTDSGQAVIRIRDTGIGMSETDVVTALEPFRQLATSRNTTGTGLGLPLTKALVEANRAHFTIKSKKTEGTLVEVAFPPTRVLAAE
ncbi:MAG TPA: ATP-binding protein [Beijerinckiaceae bacterium]|nr:ATP-binding protein [Beijerinckiaceae bacterium]